MAMHNPLDALPSNAKAWLHRRRQPEWIAPMMATLTYERFSRKGWLFEPNWDGERCLAFGRGSALMLYSRNRVRLNEKYPEIAAAFATQDTSNFIADGEVVTFEDGITSFAKLQERMHVQHPSADLLRRVPVRLYLFDLLYFDRYDTRHLPLQYRKQLLRRAFDYRGALRFTKHCEEYGEVYYLSACRKRWEGVIAKDGSSLYVSRRTRDWLKFKCHQQQEFVIGGYTDPRGHRISFGALLLGFYRKGKLVYAGKVGTGLDQATLQRLGRRLARLEISDPPFAEDGFARRNMHWVRPMLVAEIAFTEWTPTNKLRHPRILGLREDKQPSEVVREG